MRMFIGAKRGFCPNKPIPKDDPRMTEIQPPTSSTTIATAKIYYLDYCRVLLTVLVILHHVCIAYGAPGGWYFRQPTTSVPAQFGLTLVVATNQAFFMGLFFMLSAYFVEPSYQRKGAVVFVLDRLKRLGIPLLFYSLMLSPVVNFLIYRYGHHQSATFWQYLNGYDDWIDPGVLWFTAALLVFTVSYAALRQLSALQYRMSLPSLRGMLLFAVGIGLISFLVRLRFPIGWVLHPLGFQLCYFPQYIAFFIVGVLARQNHWFDQLSDEQGKRFGRLALVLVVGVLPLLLVVSSILREPTTNYSGGWNWQALSLSLWEQLTAVTIIVALLTYCKRYWNTHNAYLDKAARCAYAVYIFHPLVIVALSLLLSEVAVEPMSKLMVVAPLAVIGSFVVGGVVLRFPGAKQIL